MESGPETPRLSWQDITIESIYALMTEEKYQQAKLAATIRLEALSVACADIDNGLTKAETKIPDITWQAEKMLIQAEMKELAALLDTLEHELQRE